MGGGCGGVIRSASASSREDTLSPAASTKGSGESTETLINVDDAILGPKPFMNAPTTSTVKEVHVFEACAGYSVFFSFSLLLTDDCLSRRN